MHFPLGSHHWWRVRERTRPMLGENAGLQIDHARTDKVVGGAEGREGIEVHHVDCEERVARELGAELKHLVEVLQRGGEGGAIRCDTMRYVTVGGGRQGEARQGEARQGKGRKGSQGKAQQATQGDARRG